MFSNLSIHWLVFRKLLFLILFIFSSTSVIFAEKYVTKHFSFEIPSDWERIPNKVVDEYLDSLGTLGLPVDKAIYDTGFQLKNAEFDFDFPYFFIKHYESKKYSDSEIVKFANSGLTGSIPSEIGSLTNLTELYLQSNHLTGSIPLEIGNLTDLTHLWLSDNLITDSIPPEIGNLINLTWLDLTLNELTGSIPPEIGNLTNLEWLYLSTNQLTGSIPLGIGNLTNLTHLRLNDNQLTGEIPETICDLNLNWSNGGRFNITNNQLCPPYPSCIEDYVGYQDTTNCEQVSIIDETLPITYNLYNAYPNPFNPMTTLRYDLPEDGFVNITIYDMMGRVVSNLVSTQQNAGYKSIQWNATNNAGQPVSAGLYLYTIEAGEFRQTKKMVLLK